MKVSLENLEEVRGRFRAGTRVKWVDSEFKAEIIFNKDENDPEELHTLPFWEEAESMDAKKADADHGKSVKSDFMSSSSHADEGAWIFGNYLLTGTVYVGSRSPFSFSIKCKKSKTNEKRATEAFFRIVSAIYRAYAPMYAKKKKS